MLFLASTHAPLQFSANCRTEFYMALELVKDMSAKSWVSQRLWRTVRSLKAYAPRLGLQQDDDSHNSAALAMAGMSGPGRDQQRLNGAGTHQSGSPDSMVSTPTFSRPQRPGGSVTPAAIPPNHPSAEDRNNGLMLHSEMTRIFEGYLGMGGIPPTSTRGKDDARGAQRAPSANGNGHSPALQSGEGPGAYPRDLEMYEQFKDMF